MEHTNSMNRVAQATTVEIEDFVFNGSSSNQSVTILPQEAQSGLDEYDDIDIEELIRADEEKLVLRFDYDSLPSKSTGTKNKIREEAVNILMHIGTTAKSLVEIGRSLLTVKNFLEHGEFGDWIATEFRLSERSAQNYMSVAKRFDGKSEIVALFPARVVYQLSAPSTPQIVVDNVVKEVKAGNVPTPDEVTAQINTAKKSRAKPTLTTAKVAAARKTSTVKVEPAQGKKEEPVACVKLTPEQLSANADRVVAMLKARLGADFARFTKLIEKVSAGEFEKAMKRASVDAGATIANNARQSGVPA